MRPLNCRIYKLVLALAVLSPLGGVCHVSAAPMLPKEVLGDDVIGILLIDATKAVPSHIAKTAEAIFGRYAPNVNNVLGRWARHRDAFVAAGGNAMAFAYIDAKNNAGVANPVYLFSLRKDADKQAVINLIKQVGGKNAKINTVGGWLAAYDRRLAFPWLERGKASRVDLFQKALAPIKTCPAVIAFVPSRKLRLGMANAEINYPLARGIADLQRMILRKGKNHPDAALMRTRLARMQKLFQFDKDMLAFNQQLIKSESVSISLTAGADPTLSIHALMASNEDAQKLIGLQLPLAKAIAAIRDTRDFRDMYVDMIAKMFAYDAILKNAIARQDGKSIRMTVKGQQLIQLATTAAAGLVKMQAESATVKSINHMKVISFALLAYARDHNGSFPATLEELGRLQFVDNLSEVLTNPRTGEKQGYIYIRPRHNLSYLAKGGLTSKTPVLYEARNGKPMPGSLVAYVSGKVMRPGR